MEDSSGEGAGLFYLYILSTTVKINETDASLLSMFLQLNFNSQDRQRGLNAGSTGLGPYVSLNPHLLSVLSSCDLPACTHDPGALHAASLVSWEYFSPLRAVPTSHMSSLKLCELNGFVKSYTVLVSPGIQAQIPFFIEWYSCATQRCFHL